MKKSDISKNNTKINNAADKALSNPLDNAPPSSINNKLDRRRRIEDLNEAKRLRNELTEFY